MYVAVLRREGGKLLKTSRKTNSQLFFPDTCFSNTARAPVRTRRLARHLSHAPCLGAGHLLPRLAEE